MNKKVGGFTLLEAMVSILLSSLLVLFTFSIYRNFNQYYQIYSKQTDRLNTIINFKQTFNRDWEQALKIEGDENEVSLINDLNSVFYEFKDSIIVRNGNSKITFALIASDIKLERELNTSNITKIALELENNKQTFLFSFSKYYGIESLVNKQ